MLDDLQNLRERGKAALGRRQFAEAVRALRAAAEQTHVAEQDYVSVLNPLVAALRECGAPREALTVQWYLAIGDPRRWPEARELFAHVPKVDVARTLYAMGEHGEAARAMEEAGLVAAAAVCREQAKDFSGARALWSRLASASAMREGAYTSALVFFNLCRAAKACGDKNQAREASVSAVRLLEEAADYFESIGQRERAFDCFQVLTHVGREMGAFEDVLEGYVNCIRILREDHLKYFALAYFDESLNAAKERGEYSAAASVAREISEYCRAMGMPQAASHYLQEQGKLWREVAEAHRARGAPPEISENALLSAVMAHGELGQWQHVGKIYGELAKLDLEEARLKHYARAAQRYRNVTDEPLDAAPLPSHLGNEGQTPEVWHVDVLEWEQQGSASEACADVLLDKKWPDLVRRRAMLARLTAFAPEARPNDVSDPMTQERVKLCGELAQLQLYSVLSPLESMFSRPEPRVKQAVLAAMQTLFFKRSFVTIRQALRERDNHLLEQTAKTIEALYFQHAFDPLSRIVRESSEPLARGAALRAISRIDTQEAAEFLVGILDHGAPADRAAAIDGLTRSRATRAITLARGREGASASLREAVTTITRARGMS